MTALESRTIPSRDAADVAMEQSAGVLAADPDARSFFPALDGARAVGAIMVVATHCAFRSGQSLEGTFWSHITARFTFGVALFFVLSGFLLYRPFAAVANGKRRPHVGRYLRRRAARIIPPLWVFIIVTLTWVEKPRGTWQEYLSFLTLSHMFNGLDNRAEMKHLWSLSTEVSFYLLLPLLGLLLVGRRGRGSRSFARQVIGIGLLILSSYVFLVVWSVGVISHPQAPSWVFAYFSWFGGGMLLAALSVAGKAWVSRWRAGRTLLAWAGSLGLCWGMAVALFLLSTLPFGKPYDLSPARLSQVVWENLLYGLAAFFFLLPLVLAEHKGADRVLGGRVGKFLGDISYSIYLWHVPLILAAEWLTGSGLFQGGFLLLFAVTLGLTIVVSSASWFLIERPALRYLSGRRQAATASTQQVTTAP